MIQKVIAALGKSGLCSYTAVADKQYLNHRFRSLCLIGKVYHIIPVFSTFSEKIPRSGCGGIQMHGAIILSRNRR